MKKSKLALTNFCATAAIVIASAGCSSFQADKATVMKMDIDLLCEGEGKFKCHLKGGRATDDSTKETGQDTKVPAGIF